MGEDGCEITFQIGYRRQIVWLEAHDRLGIGKRWKSGIFLPYSLWYYPSKN